MMKKISLLIIGLIFITLIYAVTQQVTSFVDQENPFNLTFTGDENITLFLDIPYGFVGNVTLRAQVYNISTFTNDTICYQETANKSEICGALDTGTYNHSNITGREDHGIMSINYTKPDDATYNITWFVSHGNVQTNITLPDSCSNATILLRLISKEGSGSWSQCYNQTAFENLTKTVPDGSGGIGFFGDGYVNRTFDGLTTTGAQRDPAPNFRWEACTGSRSCIQDESIYWELNNTRHFNSTPLNTYLEIGTPNDDREWEQTISPNDNINFSVNVTVINDILSNNCNCINCSRVGGNCRIPFLFHSDTLGILELKILNISYSFDLDNCSNSFDIPSNATSLNISFFNEESTPENINYESTIDYFFLPNTTILGNYSTQRDNINFTQLCIYPSWANLSGNMQIRYTDPFDNIFDYFTFHTLFDNSTDNLNLFTQNGTTQVLFTVQDQDSNRVENAYLHILKYDVGTGTYTTTEVLKTDSQGQALGNIVLGTVFYNFLIFFEGRLVYTEQAVKLIATTRTFTVDITGDDWFGDFSTTLGVATSLIFNDVTQNFVYTWADVSGAVHLACLRVDKVNDTGKFNLSDSCTEATSGTILYNVPILENGTTYTGIGYLKFDNEIITDTVHKVVSKVRAMFNKDPMGALFIAFLLCLVLVLSGIPNPAISITLLVVGIIFSSYIGLWQISILQIVSLAILGLIQLYLAGRQNQ